MRATLGLAVLVAAMAPVPAGAQIPVPAGQPLLLRGLAAVAAVRGRRRRSA